MKTDFDTFTDVLKRGQIRFDTKKWASCTPVVKEGTCVYIHDGKDEVRIDFNQDGSVCTYEDFEL